MVLNSFLSYREESSYLALMQSWRLATYEPFLIAVTGPLIWPMYHNEFVTIYEVNTFDSVTLDTQQTHHETQKIINIKMHDARYGLPQRPYSLLAWHRFR